MFATPDRRALDPLVGALHVPGEETEDLLFSLEEAGLSLTAQVRPRSRIYGATA